jgi:molybdate transport system regulatory protein
MEDSFAAAVVADGVRFDERDAALLRAVDERGSLHAASDALGRSYARAHGRVGELEETFGPLVERSRGGAGGGGSRLTADGRELLARFQRLQAAFAGTAAAAETVLEGRVTGRDGELVTVETAAGPVRALAAGEQIPDRVQVAVRADSVTLQAPVEAPDDGATSARNRLAGTVERLDRRETVATVAVDAGADRPLVALVTVDSVDRLGLAPGVEVVATWKATATRAVGHTSV